MIFEQRPVAGLDHVLRGLEVIGDRIADVQIKKLLAGGFGLLRDQQNVADRILNFLGALGWLDHESSPLLAIVTHHAVLALVSGSASALAVEATSIAFWRAEFQIDERAHSWRNAKAKTPRIPQISRIAKSLNRYWSRSLQFMRDRLRRVH